MMFDKLVEGSKEGLLKIIMFKEDEKETLKRETEELKTIIAQFDDQLGDMPKEQRDQVKLGAEQALVLA